MAEPKPKSSNNSDRSKSRARPFNFVLVFVAFPVALAAVLYRLEPFEPVELPLHELAGPTVAAPARNDHMLRGAERIGDGALPKPEDLAYDAEEGVIYTGCVDGWVKRVTVNDSAADSVVENWVNTGGRPLGLVLGRDGRKLLVADSEKGLLSISKEGVVEVLSEEAEGLKFKLADGIDVAEDGMIYFTDATHKYPLKNHTFDLLEGKPHGRLLSYDPVTKRTEVLLRDLYFPNGVLVSTDQNSVLFCETVMRRCRRYHLKGEKKGSVEPLIEMLPGLPDNIRYDGQGLYWIALPTKVTADLELAMKYPFIRKIVAIMERYVGRPKIERDSGVFAVDLDGKPVYHFYDPGLSSVTTGIKIGNHLYCGSVVSPYILRLNLLDYPALPQTELPHI